MQSISETQRSGPAIAALALAEREDEVFLTLTVAGQTCSIPVLLVRDVLGPQAITPIPLAPAEVAGGLNLRGRIVTAIDVRCRLGLPVRAAGDRSMSVVVENKGELYSLVVDEVGEVIALPDEQFERNPPTLDLRWRDVSTGIFGMKGRLLVVLDVPALLRIGAAAH